MIININWNIL